VHVTTSPMQKISTWQANSFFAINVTSVFIS